MTPQKAFLHDPAVFQQYPVADHFHRVVLGLTGRLFVLAEGQQQLYFLGTVADNQTEV